MTDDAKLRSMVEEIHCAIVGNIDGTPGLMERVRKLENFRDTINNRLNGIRNYLIGNGTTVLIGVILMYLKLRHS